MMPSLLRSSPSSHPSPETPCSSNRAYSFWISAAVGSNSPALSLDSPVDAVPGCRGSDEFDVLNEGDPVEVDARGDGWLLSLTGGWPSLGTGVSRPLSIVTIWVVEDGREKLGGRVGGGEEAR